MQQADGATSAESKGIHFNAQTGGSFATANSVRVDDAILGSHTNGTGNGDNRSRQFTVSAYTLIDPDVSDGQLQYTDMPLFGLTMENGCGPTFMADVVLKNGNYDLAVNTSIYGMAMNGTGVTPQTARKGEWVLLALTVDDTAGQARLYVDGTLAYEVNYQSEGIVLRSDDTAVFHMTNMKSSASIAVSYDDFKIAGKVLSEEEIAELPYSYEAGSVPEYLVGYYTFDETTGTVGEYPNLGHGGDVKAQVMSGTPGWSGNEFTPTPAAGDFSCEGHENVYGDLEAYAVTYSITGEGTVTLSTDDGTVYENGAEVPVNTVLHLLAEPAEHYVLSSVTVNNEAQADLDNVQFTVTGITAVDVTFTQIQAQVKADDGSAEGGTYRCLDPATGEEYPLAGGYYQIPYGSEVLVDAEAREGYRVVSITVSDGTTTEELGTRNPVFTIAADMYEITVTYIARYSVNYSSSENGSIEVRSEGRLVSNGEIMDAGTQLTVTAIPDADYHIKYVTVNDKEVTLDSEGSYTFVLDGEVTVYAEFEEDSSVGTVAVESACYDAATKTVRVPCEALIRVIALDGRNVLSATGNSLSVNGLSDGLYVVTVEAQGAVRTFKIAK